MTAVSLRQHLNRSHPLNELTLPRPLATRLLFEAQKSPDTEVCGFVGSRDGRACNIYPIANIADNPESRFEMEPAEQVAAIKSMRERGETMLAVYHSHPDTPPEPSVHDIEGLGYPDALLFIISLDIKGVLEMRAWRCDGERTHEVPLNTG